MHKVTTKLLISATKCAANTEKNKVNIRSENENNAQKQEIVQLKKTLEEEN